MRETRSDCMSSCIISGGPFIPNILSLFNLPRWLVMLYNCIVDMLLSLRRLNPLLIDSKRFCCDSTWSLHTVNVRLFLEEGTSLNDGKWKMEFFSELYFTIDKLSIYDRLSSGR